MSNTFRSLHVRNYRLFFNGQMVSLVGNWMQIVAQDWLVLQVSHNSGTALGVVTALQFTPVLLLTLYGGKLADRYDKRKLLMLANVVWLMLALGMGLLVLSGAVTLPIVYLFASGLGLVQAVETPVRQSFVSELVDNSLLPNALSLNATAFNSARIFGPAVAGLAVAAVGVGPVFLVNSLTYGGPLVALWRMRPAELHRDTPQGAKETAPPKVLDGLRYVRQRPDLLLPMSLIFIVGLLGFNFRLTLPLLTRTVFHAGAASFGLLTTALAGGALAGALVSGQRRGRPSVYLVVGAAAAFSALETIAGFAPSFWTLALLLLPTGFFMIFFAQAANQRVQLGTEARLRGRVMALYVLVFLGTTPVGAPIIGWWAEQWGPRSTIWLGGLGSLLATAVIFAVRCRQREVRIHVHIRPMPRIHLSEPDKPLTACVPAVRPAVR